jgi:hypothetical protein
VISDQLNSSVNANVLLPAQPTFLLELVDMFVTFLNKQVKIVVISESSHSVVEYANINLDYLNVKLQEKIYNAENPLSFDKLFKDKRLAIFPSILEYLNFKKQNQTGQIINEFERELFIASHESLRMGDAAYLFQNFNMQKINLGNQEQTDFSVVLTDPLLGNSEFLDNLLIKPF